MKESRAILRDDPYAHARLDILKAISIHFTSFTGSTLSRSTQEHAVHNKEENKKCDRK
jgi:hypothetical protein